MGFRFRKSIKIFPGLRVNLSKTGASLSVGGRGASVNIGPRGAYGNVGLPGTGLSYRERLDTPTKKVSRRPSQALPENAPETYRVEIENDEVVILTNNDDVVSGAIRKTLITQNYEAIRSRLEDIAQERNQKIEKALTPSIANVRICGSKPVVEPGESVSSHMTRVGEWRALMANSAEQRLIECLESVEWGKEPEIVCEIIDGISLIEIDMPGIDVVPTARYQVVMSSNPRLSIQGSSAVQKNKIYTQFICSTMLAVADAITISMPDMKTIKIEARDGEMRNQIVATLEVSRERWIPKEDGVNSVDRLLRIGGNISPKANGKLAAVKSILR